MESPLALQVCPIEVRPAVYPLSTFSFFGQSVALSYSFTFQLCAMTWGEKIIHSLICGVLDGSGR